MLLAHYILVIGSATFSLICLVSEFPCLVKAAKAPPKQTDGLFKLVSLAEKNSRETVRVLIIVSPAIFIAAGDAFSSRIYFLCLLCHSVNRTSKIMNGTQFLVASIDLLGIRHVLYYEKFKFV